MSPIPVGLIVRVINFFVDIRDEVHDSRDGHDLIREHDLKTEKDRERDQEKWENDQEELCGSVDRELAMQRQQEQQIHEHLKTSGVLSLAIGAIHLLIAFNFLGSFRFVLGIILGAIWIILAFQAFAYPRNRLLAFIGGTSLAEGLLCVLGAVPILLIGDEGDFEAGFGAGLIFMIGLDHFHLLCTSSGHGFSHAVTAAEADGFSR